MNTLEQLLNDSKALLNRNDYNGDGPDWKGVTISLGGNTVCSLPHHCDAPEDMTAARDLGDLHRSSFEAGVEAAYLVLKAEGKL